MAIIESLHDLGTDLKALAATNANLLDAIQSLSSKKAISAYNFSLQYNLPIANSLTEVVDGTSQAWSFNTKEQTDSISERLEKWQYNGEPLEQPMDIFNDNINYTLESYHDVIRLNKDLLKVG
eukprot:5843987-Ditylum_brightwellii.AAC.1